MKVLFAIIVFVASTYLLLPENAYQKLSSLMPQNKVESAAKNLLLQVDTRLENFEENSMKAQEQSTTQLLATLATLEQTVNAQQRAIDNLTNANKQLSEQQKSMVSRSADNKAIAALDEFKPEPPLAETQIINTHSVHGETLDTSQQNSVKREQSIKRQALLQDIADRMNATSLLALTND